MRQSSFSAEGECRLLLGSYARFWSIGRGEQDFTAAKQRGFACSAVPCVAAYFPEANVLVPIGSVALRSNTPTSKAVVVTLAASRVEEDSRENEKVKVNA
jgi:hypothetical protein